MNSRIWAFAIYSILFEAIVWGIFAWAVFLRDYSPWWFVLAFVLSSSQLKPKHFGINMANKTLNLTEKVPPKSAGYSATSKDPERQVS